MQPCGRTISMKHHCTPELNKKLIWKLVGGVILVFWISHLQGWEWILQWGYYRVPTNQDIHQDFPCTAQCSRISNNYIAHFTKYYTALWWYLCCYVTSSFHSEYSLYLLLQKSSRCRHSLMFERISDKIHKLYSHDSHTRVTNTKKPRNVDQCCPKCVPCRGTQGFREKLQGFRIKSWGNSKLLGFLKCS